MYLFLISANFEDKVLQTGSFTKEQCHEILVLIFSPLVFLQNFALNYFKPLFQQQSIL